MSLRRRLFRLWIVLSFAYAAAVIWHAWPIWNALERDRQDDLRELNSPAPKPVCQLDPFDALMASQGAAPGPPTCTVPPHETRAEMQQRYDSEGQFMGEIVRDQTALAIAPPLLVLLFGWGILWALAPRKLKT
jgi:hypothetical protein